MKVTVDLTTGNAELTLTDIVINVLKAAVATVKDTPFHCIGKEKQK